LGQGNTKLAPFAWLLGDFYSLSIKETSGWSVQLRESYAWALFRDVPFDEQGELAEALQHFAGDDWRRWLALSRRYLESAPEEEFVRAYARVVSGVLYHFLRKEKISSVENVGRFLILGRDKKRTRKTPWRIVFKKAVDAPPIQTTDGGFGVHAVMLEWLDWMKAQAPEGRWW